MLPEIALFNGNICDIEKQFGITFSWQSAAIAIDGTNKCLHIVPNEWTKTVVAPNKRIIGLIAGLIPSLNECGLAVIVYENSGTAYTGFEIWDIDSNVLQSGSIPSGTPDYDNGPKPDIFKSTVHDVTVSKDTVTGNIRITGTSDVSLLWGLIEFDTCTFDVTINPTTLQPV